MMTCKTAIILSKATTADLCCLAKDLFAAIDRTKKKLSGISSVEKEEDLQNLKLPFKEAIAFVQLVHIRVALQFLFCSQPQIEKEALKDLFI